MLPIKNRIRKNEDFKQIAIKGRFLASENRHIAIKYIPNKENISRVGFVVSKKFSLKAVERNRAKRVLREVFKQILPQLKTGYDLAVFFQKKIQPKITLKETQAEVEVILKKNNFYKK